MKKKLSRVQGPWRRRTITVLLNVVLLIGKLIPHPRAHWIGRSRRTWRPERFLMVLLFLGAGMVLQPREFATWAILAGGTTSLFVVFNSIYLLLPRKRGHWV